MNTCIYDAFGRSVCFMYVFLNDICCGSYVDWRKIHEFVCQKSEVMVIFHRVQGHLLSYELFYG